MYVALILIYLFKYKLTKLTNIIYSRNSNSNITISATLFSLISFLFFNFSFNPALRSKKAKIH